jgi:hypothetical protein
MINQKVVDTKFDISDIEDFFRNEFADVVDSNDIRITEKKDVVEVRFSDEDRGRIVTFEITKSVFVDKIDELFGVNYDYLIDESIIETPL